jgi:hypothetical protein
MKKYLAIFIILAMVGYAYAQRMVRPVDDEADKLDFYADNMTITTVSCSSVTATSLLTATATRKAFMVQNIGTQTVYLSTYAATSSTALYDIGAGEIVSDSGIQVYNGALFGLTTANQSSQSVKVIETN